MNRNFIEVRETLSPAEQLRVYGFETELVKCPAGHILMSFRGLRPRNFRIYKKCKSCRKYYEIRFGEE